MRAKRKPAPPPPPPPPPPPSGGPTALVAAAVAPLEVRLSWTHASAPPDTRYEIERGNGAGGWYRSGATYAGLTAYTDWGRPPGTSQSYRVRAVNSLGASPYTATASAVTLAEDGEFVGPLPTWKSVKDYGAVGNRTADDTTALQNALNAVASTATRRPLYIPAGTYRFTAPLRLNAARYQGVAIIGEDPSATTLLWDGAGSSQTMLTANVWYSKISRLAWDGNGGADVRALALDGLFSSYNELSDCHFRNLGHGLVAGAISGAGQAELFVTRCRWQSVQGRAISLGSGNTLDVWVRYCRFADCGTPIHSTAGSWQSFHNVFLRSTVADHVAGYSEFYSVVNNYSQSARQFYRANGNSLGSPVVFQGNRIIDPQPGISVALDDTGNYLLLDNQIRAAPGSTGATVMFCPWGDTLAVSNLASRAGLFDLRMVDGRFRLVDEQVVDAATIDPEPPTLPATPPNGHRTIFPVTAAATAGTMQTAVNAAAAAGSGAVVHVGAGSYDWGQTITVPAGSDVQIVGDAAADQPAGVVTRINWTGAPGVPLFHLRGPSKARISDLFLQLAQNVGVRVDQCSQSGAHVYSDQLLLRGNSDVDWMDDGLRARCGAAEVTLLGFQGGNAGRWVVADGAYVHLQTGLAFTGRLLYDVQHGGTLIARAVYLEKTGPAVDEAIHIDLDSSKSGTLVMDNHRFSCQWAPSTPFARIMGFAGDVLLSTSKPFNPFTPPAMEVAVGGAGSATRVLVVANKLTGVPDGTKLTADDVWTDTSGPAARAAFLLNGCNEQTPNWFHLADRGEAPAELVQSMLNHLRRGVARLPGATPGGVTDVRLRRLMILGGAGSVGVDLVATT